MAKEKKITVKFFPKKSDVEEKKYSLYCRVTYNRKSTMFSLRIHWTADTLELAKEYIEKELKNNEHPFFLRDRISWIERIVRLEISFLEEQKTLSEEYNITGFGKRMNIYLSRLDASLSQMIYTSIFDSLKNIVTYNQYYEIVDRLKNQHYLYPYFCVFDSLKLLSDDYNVTYKRMEKEDPSIYPLILSVGFLNCYFMQLVNNKGDIITPRNEVVTLDNVATKGWIHSNKTIGDFLANDNNWLVDFENYLKSEKSIKDLIKFSNREILDYFSESEVVYFLKDNVKRPIEEIEWRLENMQTKMLE